MGKEFRYWCPVETWRFLCFAGIMFAVIITFQRFELPSSNILSSISSVHIDQGAENGSVSTDGALLKSEAVSNVTQLYGRNSVDSDNTHGSADNYRKEKDADVNNDFPSDVIDNREKKSSHQQVVQPNVYSAVDPVKNSGLGYETKETGESFSPENIISFPLENTTTSDVNDTGLNKSSRVDEHDIKTSVEQVVQPHVHSTIASVNSSGKGSGALEIEENVSFLSQNPGTSSAAIASNVPILLPKDSSIDMTFPMNVESNVASPLTDVDRNTSVVEKVAKPILDNEGKSGELKHKTTILYNNSSPTPISFVEKMPKKQTPGVISVSEMNSLLLQSWSSPGLMRTPRWASAVDQELLRAKSQIENAPIVKNDPILYAPLYWNVSMFKRSYELMEEILKVYIYKEGEKPILHQPLLNGIYASEGWFMKLLEASKKFVTKKPRKAHIFYLPFSSRNLKSQLYVADSHKHKNLIHYLRNYLDLIVAKYPFWNRTEGRDHFLVACHDWAPSETRQIMSNCIRALCNSDVKEGFVFGKDVSLPETYVRNPQNPLQDLGGKPASRRSVLAFFAGSMHGYLRPILLEHWQNKDPDMKIFGRMPKTKAKARGKMNYLQYMKSSKYCICPRGYEVNSPRIVEAISYECVPVIISDNYVPPFFEILNWESFAVFVLEKDIPNLKNILLSIPERRYRQMQMRVKKVQQHFLWHARPVKYDLFHMILHSVWYNRVFQMQPR